MSFVILLAGAAPCQDSATIADEYYLMGNAAVLSDDPDSALLYYREARIHAISLLQLSRIDQNTGTAWFSKSDFEKAARYFSHALRELQSSGVSMPRRMLDLFDNLGSACFENGDLDKARSAWNASTELAATWFPGDSMLQARMAHQSGLVFYASGSYDSAAIMFLRAMQDDPVKDDLYAPFTAMVRRNLALALMKTDSLAEAGKIMEVYIPDHGDPVFNAEVMRLRAWLRFAGGNSVAADSILASGSALLERVRDKYYPELIDLVAFRSLRDRASVMYLASAEPLETFEMQKRAFAALDACRGVEGRIPEFITDHDSLDLLTERTLETGLGLTRSGKIMTGELLSLISVSKNEQRPQNSLDNEWLVLNRRLYREERKAMEIVSQAGVIDPVLETSLFNLKNRLDSLGGPASRSDSLTTGKNAMLGNILTQGKAILDYHCFSDKIFLFVVRQDTTVLTMINRGQADPELLTRFRTSLKTADDVTFNKTAPAVADLLLGPAMPYLQCITKISVTGRGLEGIPFESLPVMENGRRVLVVEKFAVTYYHPDAQGYLSSENNEHCRFAGFAPSSTRHEGDLVNTAGEVESIGRMFAEHGCSSMVYDGEDAGESALLGEMRDASVIHISTHAKVDQDYPVRSGLRFWKESPVTTGDELIDGILELGEVRGLRMGCDLLTLSSCTLGNNEPDPVSIFLDAGAGNVLSSFWNVSDRHTRTLMCDFYRFVLNGDDYAEALKKAKVKMLGNEATASPYLWASFILSTH